MNRKATCLLGTCGFCFAKDARFSIHAVPFEHSSKAKLKDKRNTKNKDKLNALKLSPEIKLLLKGRASQTLFEPQALFRRI
jgi:hypothetical protein